MLGHVESSGMFFIVRTGFVLCSLTQEIISLIYLSQIFRYFDHGDPFASRYFRGISPAFPHPLQTAHLAFIAVLTNIILSAASMLMLIRTPALLEITQSKSSLVSLFTGVGYQFVSSSTAVLTSLTSIVLWRDTFARTFREVATCTFARKCTHRQNILDPWQAFLSLHREWGNCLAVEGLNFREASIHRKLDLIKHAFRKDALGQVKCLKDGYQEHFVSAMSNYILNGSLCTLITMIHLIYLALMLRSKPAHLNTEDTMASHSLQGLAKDHRTSDNFGDLFPEQTPSYRIRTRKHQLGTRNRVTKERLLPHSHPDEPNIWTDVEGQTEAIPENGISLEVKQSGSSVESAFFQQVHGGHLFKPREQKSLIRLLSKEPGQSLRKDSSNEWNV